ncbi:ABC transporter ATP-binding protein, partial [Elstera litoralis]
MRKEAPLRLVHPKPTTGVLLEVRNLQTQFPTRSGLVKAVDGVSFSLERGKTLCIVGESGSGKSVTARSILQIVDAPGRITGGEMIWHRADGTTVDLAKLDPRSKDIRQIRGRDIAMIFQEPMSSLSPIHTVGNQIIEVLRLHLGMSKAEARERCIELLRQVEIPRPEQAIDRYTFEFSGGMRQRVMIAMSLACDPLLLIADEPTTALDVTTQAEIIDLIRRLQKDKGMAVMFITHDMGVVAEIADEVLVMYHGKVMESGPVDQIFHAPQDDYTRML